MNITYEQLMDNSFVLSIQSDRIDNMKKIFKYNDLFVPRVYPGFTSDCFKQMFQDNAEKRCAEYNCMLGHCSIIKMAKCLDMPFVCILEDDAYPCDNIRNEMDKYLSNIPDDCDILAIGWSKILTESRKINDTISRITKAIWGAHSYIVFKQAYDSYLLKYNDWTKNQADSILSHFVQFGSFYHTNKNLFIQYNINGNTVNGHVGFNSARGIGSTETEPPAGFSKWIK